MIAAHTNIATLSVKIKPKPRLQYLFDATRRSVIDLDQSPATRRGASPPSCRPKRLLRRITAASRTVGAVRAFQSRDRTSSVILIPVPDILYPQRTLSPAQYPGLFSWLSSAFDAAPPADSPPPADIGASERKTLTGVYLRYRNVRIELNS